MAIHRLHTRALGHAATIVACEATGDALVVDPGRDVAPLIALLDEHGLTARFVLDTHGHNDYLSGLNALVVATGATAIAYVDSPVTYASRRVADGERIAVGDLDVDVLHTPGHTPEHVAVLVRDGDRIPVLVSGGSLLVGDVGRPDLLGGDGDIEDATDAAMHSILEVLLPLGDDVRVVPTHVAGSLCAGAIGEGLETTIGEQRRTNPTIAAMLAERDGGARWLDRATLPPVPLYWPRMRGANLAGVDVVDVPGAPSELVSSDLTGLIADGAVVLDVRTPDAFAREHIAGSYFAPVGDGVPTWAGSAVPEQTPIVLVTASASDAARATADLWRIGLGPVMGWVDAVNLSGERASIEQSSITEALADADATVLDVRAPLEHRSSPIPGAVEVPATALLRDPTLAPSGLLHIVCASGIRSTVVAAALAREGRSDVVNVRGGFANVAMR